MNRKEELYLSIAKIDGLTRGVAFLVDKFDEPKNGVYGLWISCTHVVGETNNFSAVVSKEGRYPIFDVPIQLDIEKQSPIIEEDITLLVSTKPLPDHLVSLSTNHEWNSTGNNVCLYGFPKDSNVNGVFEDDIIINSVRITDKNNNPQISFKSTEITEGFSGSPIFDITQSSVVGMAIEISEVDGNKRRISSCYGIPMSFIGRSFPELELFPIAPISEERVSISSLDAIKTIQSLSKINTETLSLKDKLERNYFIRELKRKMFGEIDDDLSKHLPLTIFYDLLSGDPISKTIKKDLSFLIADQETPWYDKCLVVSALTISLISNFDDQRLRYLINFIEEEEEKVWQRALTGVVLGLFEKEEMLTTKFPRLVNRLQQLKKKDNIQVGVKFLMSSLNQMKFKEHEEKIVLYNSILEKIPDNVPPDVKQFLIHHIQSSIGEDDVDLGLNLMFNDFKKGDKFKEPHFWFYPFYKENQHIEKMLSLKEGVIPSASMQLLLESSISLSDSQKYALCYSYNELSNDSIASLVEIFSNEKSVMEKLAREDKQAHEEISNSVFTSILNDFYQFQLFFPKHELSSILDFSFVLRRLTVAELIARQEVIAEVEFERHCNLARLFFDKEDFEGAIKQYRKAIEINPHKSSTYIKLGIVLRKNDDLEGAIQQLKKAIEIKPENAKAYHQLAMSMKRTGDFEGAIQQLKKAIEIKPEDVDTYYLLAIVMKESGDLKGAIKQLKKAIEINPEKSDSYYFLAQAMKESDDFNGAIIQLKKAIEINPENGEPYYFLAQVMKESGDLKGAIKQLRKAIEINPKDLDVHRLLAQVMKESGDLNGAIKQLKKAIEIKPESSKSNYLLAQAMTESGDIKGAIEQLNKYIEINPEDLEAYQRLAKVMEASGDFEGAVEQFKKAIQIKPENANIYNSQGFLYLKMGKLEASKKALKKSYKLDQNGHALMNLGHVHLAKKNVEKAFLCYSESRKLFKNDIVFFDGLKSDFDDCNLSQYKISNRAYFNLVDKLIEESDQNEH